MSRIIVLVLAATAAMLGCAATPEDQRIINDAATSLGGRDRLLSLKTLVLEGEGTAGNLGQDLTPEATGQTFALTNYRRLISFAANASRTEQTRTPNFPYFQGQAAQRSITGVDGDIGYTIAPNGAAARVSDAVTRDRRVEMYHHPIAAIRAALEPGAKLANAHTTEGEGVVDVTTATGVTFTIATDASTHLPTRLVSMANNLNLGDVAIETSFSDYQDVNGLKLPARLVTKTDRWTTTDIKFTRQAVDGDTGDLAAPADAVAYRPVPAVPEPVIDDQEIAKGVWLLAGQSHHSVLVELADHLMLIEAPQQDARTLAVIRKARELVPGKPLTQLVTSHHHFDHSGGVRAAISEGLTVITQAGNADFFKDIAARSHSIGPDALAKQPKSVTVETVDDMRELKDAMRTVVLYHVTGSPHSSTMLMAYLPQDKLLVEADVYTPGAAVAPYAANLLENIERRKLAVARIVPLHGSIATFADLQKTVKATQTQ